MTIKDLSIVIPVYNCKKYLEETIKSIENQNNINEINYEIILSDDGSTDGSGQLCKKLVDKNNNILYFYHENKGVSFTRNEGMKNAKGKYILFLDSDDLLEENTIYENFNLFEKYEKETDILAYPIYKFINGETKKHPRTKFYEETKLINLEENPYYFQPTMNIMIRNLFEKNVMFDEEMPYMEDNYHNLILMNDKKKILVSNKGKYLYRMTGDSTINKYSDANNSYELILDFYNKLIKFWKEEKFLPRYVQAMIINEVNWRTNFNSFFPDLLEKDELNKYKNNIRTIFEKIENNTILNHINLNKNEKVYFLEKYKEIGDLSFIPSKKDKPNGGNEERLVVYDNNNEKEIYYIEKIDVLFNKFEIFEDKIMISGYLKNLFLNEMDDLFFYINVNGEEQKIPLKNSKGKYFESEREISNFKSFNFEISLKGAGQKIIFYVKTAGVILNANVSFGEKTMMPNNLSKKRISLKENFGVFITKKSEILIHKKSPKDYARYLKYNKFGSKQIALNSLRLLKKNNKKISLYSDKKGFIGESFILFKENFNKIRNEEHFYMIHSNDINYYKKEIEPYQNNIIVFGSFEHKKMFLNAKKIYTSSIEINSYNPFNNDALLEIKDFINNEIIWIKNYMNNGIFKEKYHYDNNNISKVITKSKNDKEILINKYGFPEEKVLLKREIENGDPENGILITFGWRKNFIENEETVKAKRRESKFAKSKFYKEMVELLNSEKINFYIKSGRKVDFYLHPKMQLYADLFNEINGNINLIFKIKDFNKYNTIISDYSSLIDKFELENKVVYKIKMPYDPTESHYHYYDEIVNEKKYFENVKSFLNKGERSEKDE